MDKIIEDNVEKIINKIKNPKFDPYELFKYNPKIHKLNFLNEKCFPGYFGGPILCPSETNPEKFCFYNNAGNRVGRAILFKEAYNIYTVYVFPDSTVCFLLKDGTIQYVRPIGIKEDYKTEDKVYYKSPVIFASSSYCGLTFITQNGTLVFIDAFTKKVDVVVQFKEDFVPVICSLYDPQCMKFFVVNEANELYMVSDSDITCIASINKRPRCLECLINGKICIAIGDDFAYMIDIDKSNDPSKNLQPLKLPSDLHQLNWINSTTYLVVSDNAISIVDYTDSVPITHFNEGRKIVVADCGCIRIICERGCFLYIDNSFNYIDFRDNSRKLLYAYYLYEQNSIEFFDVLKEINNSLPIVASDFVDIAGRCTDPLLEQILMGAASLARLNENENQRSDRHVSDIFSQQIQRLRVKNTMNSDKIGFALSPQMMDWLDSILFERLINLSMYSEAISVCPFLDLANSIIAERWAIDYLYINGDTTIEFVMSKLEEYEGINYSALANECVKMKFNKSAIAFANKISNPKDRVNLMFQVDPEKAKDSAYKSSDVDSIISYLYRSEFVRMNDYKRRTSSAESEVYETYYHIKSFTSKCADRCFYKECGVENAIFNGNYEEAVSLCPGNSVFRNILEKQSKLKKIVGNNRVLSPRQEITNAEVAKDDDKCAKIRKLFKFTEAEEKEIMIKKDRICKNKLLENEKKMTNKQ